jgi:hypothetical protein
MKKSIFLLCLILGIVFPWWVENITIYVGDYIGRPIKNATVSIVYQSTSCDKHNTITKQTNESGYVNFYFMNTVDEPSTCVERAYIINIKYFHITKSQVAIVGERKDYTFFIEAAKLKIKIVGYNNSTLPFSYVLFYGNKYYADASGTVNLILPIGKEIPIEAYFGNVSKVANVLIRGDEEITVSLPVYDLKIVLYDENGKRVSGKVVAGGFVTFVEVDKEGIIEKFPYASSKFLIFIGNKSMEVEKKILSDFLEIYVDLSPPEIRDVRLYEAKGNVKIRANIFDPGKYSSGIKNVSISYRFLNGSKILQKAYLAGKDIYEVTVPARGNDFEFEILAVDGQGNENKYFGNYTFAKVGGEERKFEISFNPAIIIGIIVLVIVVVFIYKKIREAVE